MEEPRHQLKLLSIIQEDVVRLDRLISDISDASRVDAELSRTSVEPVDLAALFRTLGEIAEATRGDDDPHLVVDLPAGAVVVQAVEGRLVQVLRNLVGNAESFSPANGTITLRARETGAMVEITVEDEGPRYSGRQSGTCIRPVLFGAPGRRKIRPSFGPGPLDQPPDRGGLARPYKR